MPTSRNSEARHRSLDPLGSVDQPVARLVEALVDPSLAVPAVHGSIPLGRAFGKPPVDPAEIPKALDELGELESSTFDLTATRAGELGIPVAGGGSVGFDRRVVVFEWRRYKPVDGTDGRTYQFGFTVRFCLTVDKWDAKLKLSLPFLSAQAQLGQVEARWLMQVRGLAGTKIDQVVVPPKELSVETFVLARQSTEAAIDAVRDPTTKFVAGTVLSIVDPASQDAELWLGAVRTFALSSITGARSRTEAQVRLGTTDATALDAVTQTYDHLGLKDPTQKPPEDTRRRARQLLREIDADV